MRSQIQSVKFSDTPISGIPHYHHCHQLLFVTRGHATILLNSKEFLLSSGEILLLSRFEQHSIQDASPYPQHFICML